MEGIWYFTMILEVLQIDWLAYTFDKYQKKSVIYQKCLYEFLKVFCKIYKTIGTLHGYGHNINWFRKYL